jgi:hypothetical protein
LASFGDDFYYHRQAVFSVFILSPVSFLHHVGFNVAAASALVSWTDRESELKFFVTNWISLN